MSLHPQNWTFKLLKHFYFISSSIAWLFHHFGDSLFQPIRLQVLTKLELCLRHGVYFFFFWFAYFTCVSFVSRLLCKSKAKLSVFLNVSISQCIVVARASCEGSEDPGRGGDVSDRTESPGTFAEEELLQWRPSLLHGDPAKCDGHLQKSNLHPSFRRRAGGPDLERFSSFLEEPVFSVSLVMNNNDLPLTVIRNRLLFANLLSLQMRLGTWSFSHFVKLQS